MRIAFLGFGLIGGSIARALHARRPSWSLAAWSPSGAGPRAARDDGTIAAVATDAGAGLEGADLVIIAAPPLATLAILDDLAGPLRSRLPGTTAITDVASTKRAVVARAGEHGLPFTGGHPMAGLDVTGYGAADADLFVDRPWVIVPGDGRATGLVEELAVATGALPIRMSAEAHDAATAAISHLPLVVSAALVEAVAAGGEDPRRLAAGGWRDMTRLSRGDPDMGAGILATNADEVSARLRALRVALDSWLDLLDGEAADPDELRRRLAAVKAAAERPVER